MTSKSHRHSVMREAAFDELKKISAARIKSNDRMPARTQGNIAHLVNRIEAWDSPHRDESLQFTEKVTPAGLFEVLHSMRRWYSGGTMARRILSYRDALGTAMDLNPEAAVGAYRGFKVPNDHPLANVEVGQRLTLPVTRNHGFSSWCTEEAPAHKFSGGGSGKTGLIIRLSDAEGITPVLAPPTHTADWFNALYSQVIGNSFRPKEGEYLISAPSVNVEVVRVKR
jgi:hypothetical protein